MSISFIPIEKKGILKHKFGGDKWFLQKELYSEISLENFKLETFGRVAMPQNKHW